jgi:hypothetical protein
MLYQPEKSAVAEHSIELGHWIKFQETEVLTKTSCCMDRLVREAIEINLHPNNIDREEGFELNRAWSPTTRLLSYSDIYQTKLVRINTGESMLKRIQNNQQTGHQVKRHSDRLDSNGSPHTLTLPSCWIVCQQDEVLICQTGMYISNARSFTTLTLIMEMEEISETLVCNSTLTWLIAQEDFSTFICRKRFKYYIVEGDSLPDYMMSHSKRCIQFHSNGGMSHGNHIIPVGQTDYYVHPIAVISD